MECDEYESESISALFYVWELNFDVSNNTRHRLNRMPVIRHALGLQLSGETEA